LAVRRFSLIVVLALMLAGSAWTGSAHAAFPAAQNGRIVFDRKVNGTFHVFVMNADGSNPVDLSPADTLGDFDPQFSPNGQWIVFERGLEPGGTFHVFLMRANGTGAVDLTPGLQGAGSPTFSPDSKQIAFAMDTNQDLNSGFYTAAIMNADGSGVRDLTPSTDRFEGRPDFSPDGTRIVFDGDSGSGEAIFSINPDGTGETTLTPPGEPFDQSATFTPSGTQLAWSREVATNHFDIFVGNTALGGATDLTPGPAGPPSKASPAFSPDGTKIAFHAYGGMSFDTEIFVMPATGGPITDLSPDKAADDNAPHWEYVYMCGKRRATIVGDDGPEVLKGTKKADVIVGNGGNDVIKGKGGNDRICGGRGKDILIGGAGRKDRLIGGPGKDKIKQ
jgi:Tol biopolymer transport system component